MAVIGRNVHAYKCEVIHQQYSGERTLSTRVTGIPVPLLFIIL